LKLNLKYVRRVRKLFVLIFLVILKGQTFGEHLLVILYTIITLHLNCYCAIIDVDRQRECLYSCFQVCTLKQTTIYYAYNTYLLSQTNKQKQTNKHTSNILFPTRQPVHAKYKISVWQTNTIRGLYEFVDLWCYCVIFLLTLMIFQTNIINISWA